MVLQMVDDSFATDYKSYEINLVNKVYMQYNNHSNIIFLREYPPYAGWWGSNSHQNGVQSEYHHGEYKALYGFAGAYHSNWIRSVDHIHNDDLWCHQIKMAEIVGGLL